LPGQEVTGAEIAQLGERQTEDLKVAGSIPAFGTFFFSSNKKMYGWHFFDYFFNFFSLLLNAAPVFIFSDLIIIF
jgi:hypothetical protein